jgi:hypothetical protein
MGSSAGSTPPSSPRLNPAVGARTSPRVSDEIAPAVQQPPPRAPRVGTGNVGLQPRAPSMRGAAGGASAAGRADAAGSASAAAGNAGEAAAADHVDPELAVVPLSAFPRAAGEMEAAIRTAKNRPVDTGAAANLLNELRCYGARAHKPAEVDAAGSNKVMMNSITEAHVMQWYQAQGLSENDVHALRRSAVISGLPNPSGTFVTNAVQYMLAPAIGAATGNPWVGASIGLVTAVAAPFLNAAQQSGVVTLCEHIRERGGPSVAAEKANINDKNWLPQIAAKVASQAEKFAETSEAFSVCVAELAEKHGVAINDQHAPDALLEQLLPRLDPEEKKTFLKHSKSLGKEEGALHKLQKDLLMTQGAHERQAVGNSNQTIPRALRAPVAGLIGLTTGTQAGQTVTAHVIGRAAKVSPAVTVGIQVAASAALTVYQHIAAGFDEKNKAEYNNKLNLIYADIFTPAGKEKWEKGKDLSGDDIDPGKLRKFVSSPAQSLAKRLTTNISARIKSAEETREIIENQARERQQALGGQPAAVHAESEQPAPLLFDFEQDSIHVLNEYINKMKTEERHLKNGDITKLEPEGVAAGLLSGSLDKYMSTILKEDLIAKYKKPGELSAQTAQRIGQAFHMGVFGSAAAATIGKVGTAALGGASNTSNGQILALSSAAAVLGTVGAASQYVAINVKNNRREGNEGIGLAGQVGRGVAAAPLEVYGQVKGGQANKQANAALDRMQTNLQLAALAQERLHDVELSSEDSA